MLSEYGKVLSLKELGEAFLIFAQKSDSSTQAWELIDTRLSSFFGATLKVEFGDKASNGERARFFISLQHTDVTSSTYSSWLRNTEENYQNELYDHTLQEGNYTRVYFGKYGKENPFSDTGEFIAFGLHTLYDENLWMCEQGQVTCEKESTAQLNDCNLTPFYYNLNGRTNSSHSVVFPGTGCPWLTISDTNKKNYVSNIYPIEYWFTKDNYSATITFRIVGDGSRPARYQSVSFGKMEAVDNGAYMFPLFVAGGNQAMYYDGYTFTHGYATCSSSHSSNVYRLDMENIGLSNSNLLYPTKFNNSSISNFRYLGSDGEWKNVFSYSQVGTVFGYHTCGQCVPNFGYPLAQPNKYDNENTAFPQCSINFGMIDTYTVNERFSEFKSFAPIQNILVIQTEDSKGVVGYLPMNYFSWSRSIPSGEVELNGKKYLSVPNGWDDRYIYYPYNDGTPEWNQESIRSKIENRENVLGRAKFVHKLLIPLEE